MTSQLADSQGIPSSLNFPWEDLYGEVSAGYNDASAQAAFGRIKPVSLPGPDAAAYANSHGPRTLYAGEHELWHDMNKRAPRSAGASSSGSGAAQVALGPLGKIASFDEDEAVALLRTDGLIAEDATVGGMANDFIIQGPDDTLFDATFFSRFAANLTPESVFGIDGTGAGIGVGAGLADGSHPKMQQRKRKGHRRTDSGSSELLAPLSALMSSRPYLVGATSKEGSDNDVGSGEPEHPFAFLHDDRDDREEKIKRNSRGKYKCSRCGVSKTGHTCATLDDIEMTVTRATQVVAAGVAQATLDAICNAGNGETADGERVLTVRPRSTISS